MSGFVVKGGDDKITLAGGMVRSSSADKVDYSLAVDGVMFRRWAEHLTNATRPPAEYEKRNWLRACDPALNGEQLDSQLATHARYKESAFRHFMQWYWGDRDEDHAAAVFFNINGAETLGKAMDDAQF